MPWLAIMFNYGSVAYTNCNKKCIVKLLVLTIIMVIFHKGSYTCPCVPCFIKYRSEIKVNFHLTFSHVNITKLILLIFIFVSVI